MKLAEKDEVLVGGFECGTRTGEVTNISHGIISIHLPSPTPIHSSFCYVWQQDDPPQVIEEVGYFREDDLSLISAMATGMKKSESLHIITPT